ncbi:MAG TPA: hypothetical protein VFR68_01070 [Candidatus Dormibacteraeota bacterium]|nr:hypothetical protein [Candidatus Dormibacteraeota bacterium]
MPPRLANWKEHPDEDDYPAAENYLSLIMTPAAAARTAQRLRKARLGRWLAKDLIRASGLPILPADNYHVAKDLRKVKAGKKLSPVLLVRGRMNAERPLTIADGYHRICASWHLDQETPIPCRMVDQETDPAPARAAVRSSRAGGNTRAARR